MAHKTSRFHSMVEELMEEWKVPGFAIAVIKGDEIYTKGYGLARFPDHNVTENTLFDCASTAKSFTATAVAFLVDDNANFPDVQWKTPVSKLLPDDFVLADPAYTEKITIEDILSHRSGLPGHDHSYLGHNSSNPPTPKSITRSIRHLPLTQPPGTHFQYSNILYTAASHLVSSLTNQSYSSFLQTNLWNRLEMTNTFHDYSSVRATTTASSHLAHGYRWEKSSGNYVEIKSYSQPEGQGAGLVFSCVKDYARWVHALLQRKVPGLSDSTQNEVITPRIIIADESEGKVPFYGQAYYALGWVIQQFRGKTVIGHWGSMTGFQSSVRWVPELGWGLVTMGNSNGGNDVADVVFSVLADELLDIPVGDHVGWRAFQQKRNEDTDEEKDERFFGLDPDDVLPMRLPLMEYGGKYHNDGYHDIVLQIKNDRLWADCSDRCFPFTLWFEHLSGDDFLVDIWDILENEGRKVKSKFRIDTKKNVNALGIAFEEEMESEMIWFTRTG